MRKPRYDAWTEEFLRVLDASIAAGKNGWRWWEKEEEDRAEEERKAKEVDICYEELVGLWWEEDREWHDLEWAWWTK